MKERPILFSAEMILALRREVNPKTQTRRTRGLEKVNAAPDEWRLLYSGGVDSEWDEINGAGAWAKNEWCWRLEFRRLSVKI